MNKFSKDQPNSKINKHTKFAYIPYDCINSNTFIFFVIIVFATDFIHQCHGIYCYSA